MTAASKYGVIIQASTAVPFLLHRVASTLPLTPFAFVQLQQQDYLNGGPTGIPTNGVAITNIVFASGNKVTVGSKGKKVYVL